jgi:hypothetical protein
MSRENIENFEETDDSEEWEEGDYGFIVGPDGELKSIMFPENLFSDPPAEIKKILKIFGIKNIYEIENRTIH